MEKTCGAGYGARFSKLPGYRVGTRFLRGHWGAVYGVCFEVDPDQKFWLFSFFFFDDNRNTMDTGFNSFLSWAAAIGQKNNLKIILNFGRGDRGFPRGVQDQGKIFKITG